MSGPHDPYKKYVSGAHHAADLAGAASGVSNPMGSIQNTQAAYHTHKTMKAVCTPTPWTRPVAKLVNSMSSNSKACARRWQTMTARTRRGAK